MLKALHSWWLKRVLSKTPVASWCFSVARERGAIGQLNDSVERALLPHLPEPVLRSLQIALDELLTNVIMHAHDAQGPIELELRQSAGFLETVIDYRAREFDSSVNSDAPLSNSIADSRIGGLGLHLVQKLIGDLRYEFHGNRNRLYLRQRLD